MQLARVCCEAARTVARRELEQSVKNCRSREGRGLCCQWSSNTALVSHMACQHHQHDQDRKGSSQRKCGSAEAVAAGELDAVELPVGQQVQSKAAASFGEAEEGK